MNRFALTGVLVLGGAMVGALAAATFVAISIGLLGENPFAGSAIDIVGIAAGIGAAFGGVAGPGAGWGLLRRVPLGKAALVTAIGTVIGGVIGEQVAPLDPYSRAIPGIVYGALTGFIVAAVSLAINARRRSREDAATH